MAYLSAKDLLARKGAIQERSEERFVVSLNDDDLLFRVPTRGDIADSQNYASDGTRADEYLIYSTILEPDLRDPALQKEFLDKNADPVDIVGAIFRPGEVQTMAQLIMEQAGYFNDDVKVRKEVKN